MLSRSSNNFQHQIIGETIDSATPLPSSPAPMSMDQQMPPAVDSTTQVPVQAQHMPVIQEQAPMETQDQLMIATNFNNTANNTSNLQQLNGGGQAQNQYVAQQSSDQQQQATMQQYKIHQNGKDTNQNFVEETMDMYGSRYRLSPQQAMQQNASAPGLTGADPMLNSVAMIQNQTGPVTYPRKITRSMHQQNLIQLQQGMVNGNEADFKMELKCEPDNGF